MARCLAGRPKARRAPTSSSSCSAWRQYAEAFGERRPAAMNNACARSEISSGVGKISVGKRTGEEDHRRLLRLRDMIEVSSPTVTVTCRPVFARVNSTRRPCDGRHGTLEQPAFTRLIHRRSTSPSHHERSMTETATASETSRRVQTLHDPSLYTNRELSWLEFNQRVLDQAIDDRHPLLERVKFLAIVGSNLDEFFMVRVATLLKQQRAGLEQVSPDGLTVSQQLSAHPRARDGDAEATRPRAGASGCGPRSAEAGVQFLEPDQYTDQIRRYLSAVFHGRDLSAADAAGVRSAAIRSRSSRTAARISRSWSVTTAGPSSRA